MYKRFKVEDSAGVGIDFNTKNAKSKATRRTQREIPEVFLKPIEALKWLMPEIVRSFSDDGFAC